MNRNIKEQKNYYLFDKEHENNRLISFTNRYSLVLFFSLFAFTAYSQTPEKYCFDAFSEIEAMLSGKDSLNFLSRNVKIF